MAFSQNDLLSLSLLLKKAAEKDITKKKAFRTNPSQQA